MNGLKKTHREHHDLSHEYFTFDKLIQTPGVYRADENTRTICRFEIIYIVPRAQGITTRRHIVLATDSNCDHRIVGLDDFWIENLRNPKHNFYRWYRVADNVDLTLTFPAP